MTKLDYLLTLFAWIVTVYGAYGLGYSRGILKSYSDSLNSLLTGSRAREPVICPNGIFRL